MYIYRYILSYNSACCIVFTTVFTVQFRSEYRVQDHYLKKPSLKRGRIDEFGHLLVTNSMHFCDEFYAFLWRIMHPYFTNSIPFL